MKRVELRYEDISGKNPCFGVYTGGEFLGIIEHRWFAHVKQRGWEATGNDGHRAVHVERWQAALALAWDGKGYPFPIKRPVWLKEKNDG